MSAIGAADHPTAQAARWQPPSTSTRASYTRSARTKCRDARSSSARLQVETRVRPLGLISGALLDPEGMAIQAVRTFASGHLISGLLRRLLPAPWNVLARVLGNLIALPLGLQRAAPRPRCRDHRACQYAGCQHAGCQPGEPADDDGPIPPAAPAAVADLDAERTPHQGAIDEVLAEVEPSPARYPVTRRGPSAKRRRSPRTTRTACRPIPPRGRPFSCPEGRSCT